MEWDGTKCFPSIPFLLTNSSVHCPALHDFYFSVPILMVLEWCHFTSVHSICLVLSSTLFLIRIIISNMNSIPLAACTHSMMDGRIASSINWCRPLYYLRSVAAAYFVCWQPIRRSVSLLLCSLCPLSLYLDHLHLVSHHSLVYLRVFSPQWLHDGGRFTAL